MKVKFIIIFIIIIIIVIIIIIIIIIYHFIYFYDDLDYAPFKILYPNSDTFAKQLSLIIREIH